MRSLEEVSFRIGQELANLALWWFPPTLSCAPEPTPLLGLPAPEPIAERLRGSALSIEIHRIAEEILHHRIPLLGAVVNTGSDVRWRRDYGSGVESGKDYFRRIAYLDATRVGDHKQIWELNRHQHLVILAQAYRFTKQGTFLTEIERQLNSWLHDNPYMCGVNWVSALEVAFRSLSWMWIYHLVGNDLNDRLKQKFLTALYRHGCYLENNLSIYFSPNTHLLGEAVALHALGHLFPRFPRAQRWSALGAEVVANQMTAQVREDGSHFEQSTYYQIYALDMFVFHAVLAKTTPEFQSRLRSMAHYLEALIGPARTLPFLGDDDGGRFFHPYGPRDTFGRATLVTCAVVLGELEGWYDEKPAHEQAVWWLGLRAGNGTAEYRAKSQLFRPAGVAVLNSGQVHSLFDVGPFGFGTAGHSHSDTLSVVIRDGQEEVLIDAGTFTYVADVDLRNWFRGSAAHNTIRVDGFNQAHADGPFRWDDKPQVEIVKWSNSSTHDLVEGTCQYRNFEHRRRVLLLKPRSLAWSVLIVKDILSGPPGSHFIEQFWHPGERVSRQTAQHYQIGTRSHLIVPPEEEFFVRDSWRSRTFSTRERTVSLVLEKNSELPVEIWAAVTIGRRPTSIRVLQNDAVHIDFHDGSSITAFGGPQPGWTEVGVKGTEL